MKNKKTIAAVLVALIIALGFFIRIYNIDHAPPGIYPDEAVNGEDALRALSTGNFQWFYPANQGREGLFMNLIAICFALFGASALTLKLPAILFGTFSVLGTYFLTKELFQSRKVALTGAFLYSVSFWALNFSRISFRANMLPFILVWSFYFIFKGVNAKKLYNFVIGGFIFGIGMHTYIAFRIAPAIAIVILIAFMFSRKNFLKDYWKPIVVFFFASILSATPMFYTYWQHPEFLESRSASISVFSPEVNHGDVAQTFFRSFGLSLIKYNYVGDMNWRHNFPPYPLLDQVTGTTFLFGFIYSMIQFFRLLSRRFLKKVRDENFVIHAFLLSWFFIMLAPEFLTAEGNPHALRAIGTMPVVFIFSALTFKYLFEKAEKHGIMFKNATLAMIILIFAGTGLFNIIKYHFVWANKVETAHSFNKNLTDISHYLKTLPKDKHTYIITSYNTLEKLPIYIFNSDRTNTKYLFTNQLDQIQPGNNPFTIIMTGRHEDAIASIKNRYPNLKPEKINESLGSTYYIFK